jgi:hypothetical protein
MTKRRESAPSSGSEKVIVIPESELWRPPEKGYDGSPGGRSPLAVPAAIAVLLLLACAAAVYFDYRSLPHGDDLDGEEIRAILNEFEAPPASNSGAGASPGADANERYVPLEVTSDPAGALVRIDFDSIGITPLRGHRIVPGSYIVSIEFDRNTYLDTLIALRDVRDGRLSFSLSDVRRGAVASGGRGGLRPDVPAEQPPARQPVSGEQQPAPQPVVAEPDDAETIVQTPSEPEDETPAPSDLASSPPEQQPAEDAGAGFGGLQITSEPSGAVVTMDGMQLGVTPLQVDRVAAGSREVLIQMPGFASATSSIEIRPSETALHHAALAEARGTLKILVRPWGDVYIDGELRQRGMDVWYSTDLPVGEHTIEVRHPAMGTRQNVVEVTADQINEVIFDLAVE